MKIQSITTLPVRRGALVVAVAALALGACATPTAGTSAGNDEPVKSTPLRSAEDCVFSSVVDDYSPISDEQLIVYGPGRRQAYLTTLVFPSSGLRFGIRLGFLDSDNNGRICSFDSVLIPDGVPDRVSIKSMVRIDPAEAKRLIDASNASRKKAKKPKPGAATEAPAAAPPGSPN